MGTPSPRGKRIAILGGTFNPIHFGHLRSAEEVRERLKLDHIYFVPSFLPPHKDTAEVASAQHRLHMVELAVADNPFFSASDVELRRGGKSFSVDTIRCFLSSFSPQALYFAMGLDAFSEIHTWKDYPAIFSLCHVVVTSRPGCAGSTVAPLIPVDLQKEFRYDSTVGRYIHTSGHTLTFCSITQLAISASDIRRRIQEGRSVRYLLPAQVEAYIATHGLYREKTLSRAKGEDERSR